MIFFFILVIDTVSKLSCFLATIKCLYYFLPDHYGISRESVWVFSFDSGFHITSDLGRSSCVPLPSHYHISNKVFFLSSDSKTERRSQFSLRFCNKLASYF